MYEHMRNEVVMAMADVENPDIEDFLRAMDAVSERYDVAHKEMGLATRITDIPEAVKIYLVCKKMAGISQGTLVVYQLVLTAFFLMTGKQPQDISANDARMWLYTYQKERLISNRTLDKYREIIGRFFAWAMDEGYVQKNPLRSVESIKYEIKPREALTQLQLEYLRKACETPRELAMIETLYSTGCRVSELTEIKKSDVNWREMEVHLFGKGKKHRYSFLNARAEVALKSYLDTREDDCEYLFVSIRKPYRKLHKDGVEKIVRTISARSAIGKTISPHIIRHTTATIALQNGMPIESISKLLGHESMDTTMIYAKCSLEAVRSGHRKYII